MQVIDAKFKVLKGPTALSTETRQKRELWDFERLVALQLVVSGGIPALGITVWLVREIWRAFH